MLSERFVRALNPAGWATVLAVLALWQLLVGTGVLDYEYLPSPTEVFSSLADEIGNGELFSAGIYTIGIALLASLIAIVVGVAIGAAVGLVAPVRDNTMASLDVLRTLPVVALMPVALLIWGAGSKTEIIVASYAAVWPMVINTAGGVRTIHPRLQEVGRMLRFTRRQALLKIILPAAIPAILVGARLAIVNALVIAIVAEMLISSKGLGWSLVQAQQALQPSTMWAYAVACGIVGFAFNALVVRGVQRAFPGVRGISEGTA